MNDYIVREDAFEKACLACRKVNEWWECEYDAHKCSIREYLEAIPAADVEPVTHAKWLPQIFMGQKVWDCSNCKTMGSPHWKRCPVCEAKMDGE